jgi:L-Ala-D/L-Glu epimerase
MIIKRIEVYRLRIKLKKPFVISLGAKTHADNVVVKVITDHGPDGWGECSPSPVINGETPETCFAVARYLADHLIGKDPRETAYCSSLMDSLIYGNTSIKSAFDIAFHDIASRDAGLPLYEYLGGKITRNLYTDYTVSLNDVETMVADALEIRDNGFPFIKVKLGDNRKNDVIRTRAIREAVGDKLPLRLDANQGWDSETAIGVLKDLAGMNIQFCEEPVPRWSFMELPAIIQESPVPVMADESCLDHHDAARLLKLEACDYINIKLGKSSGLHKALKIIDLASGNGTGMMVGGFVETRLAFTASAHLAMSNQNILFCDFDSPMMMVDDPVSGGIEYGKDGLVRMPEGPGLGAWIEESMLESLPSFFVE